MSHEARERRESNRLVIKEIGQRRKRQVLSNKNTVESIRRGTVSEPVGLGERGR